MKPNGTYGLALVGLCALTIYGCANERHALSPLSPSSVSSSASDVGNRGAVAPLRRVDNDGDGYDDGPAPEPMPDPGSPPPQVPPDGAPAPVILTVNIVGAAGSGAFVPNPLYAAFGNTVVWTNTDLIPHIIVLDDGTPVGSLVPGQSSMPVSLTTETMGYHCTLHPSMVGQLTTLPPPPPGDPSQVPPGPDPYAPPSDPSDDGYEDDYYY